MDGWCDRVIIVSALSLSLRDKKRELVNSGLAVTEWNGNTTLDIGCFFLHTIKGYFIDFVVTDKNTRTVTLLI